MSEHLKRFFCDHTEVDKIARDGVFIYLFENIEDRLFAGNDVVKPSSWKDYNHARSIVLLGPPRQGKTTEFRHQCSKIAHGFFLPLRGLPTGGGPERLEHLFDDPDSWIQWKNGVELGELFIDALDEGKLAAAPIMNDVVAWIKSLGNDIRDRLRVHLSCRTAEWDRIDESGWRSLFPEAQEGRKPEEKRNPVEVVHLLDLDRKRYIEYCESQKANPNTLLHQLPQRAKQFVAKPLTLEMVVAQFTEIGSVPQNTQELYDAAIKRKLMEINPAHSRDQSRGQRASRAIAEFFASLTILSDRELIATEPGPSDEYVHTELGEFSKGEVAATLHSGLFRTHAEGLFRFDDPELAEYLAASRLNNLIDDGALSVKAALRRFLGEPTHVEPVPKLRGTMVWLAALNLQFRKMVIERNPGVLLYDFPGELSTDDKLLIWEWLKTNYGNREYFDSSDWERGVGALACSDLVPSLTSVISDSTIFGPTIRLLALEIARMGKLKDVVPIIEQTVQDVTDNLHVLEYAANALGDLVPDRLGVLRPWLELDYDADPNNRLRCDALIQLWPEHVTLQEVITCLRPSKTKSPTTGGFWHFLYDLPNQLDDDQRAQVINAMAEDLSSLVSAVKKKEYIPVGSRPSEHIVRFLLSQTKPWISDPNNIPQIELWFTAIKDANSYLTIHLANYHDKFSNFLHEDHGLKQALCKQHLERIFSEKGIEFDPAKYFNHNLVPSKEDISFWQDTLLSSLGRGYRYIDAVWRRLMISWGAAENPPELLEWLESQSSQHPYISSLWTEWKSCDLPDEKHYWRRHQAERERAKKEKRRNNIKYIQEHIKDIASGHFGLLSYLIGQDNLESNTVKERYGQQVYIAYLHGLRTFWEAAEIPLLGKYFPNRLLMETIIDRAVKYWHRESGGNWEDLSLSMRSSAIQVSITATKSGNDLYKKLVQLDYAVFQELAIEYLILEDTWGDHHASLASHMKYFNSNAIFRQIAFEFLDTSPGARHEVFIPLVQTVLTNDADDKVVNLLQNLAEYRLHEGDEKTRLQLLAAIWRYRYDKVWTLIENDIKGKYADRDKKFEEWIDALMQIHDLDETGLPDWITYKHVIGMLPDLYRDFPPSTDPTIEEYNKGGHNIKRRDKIGSLRRNSTHLVAQSGSDEGRKCLTQMIDDDSFAESRVWLLLSLDRWHKARALRTWHRLSPKDLEEVLTRGKRQIQSHADLFDVCKDIIEDIKTNIEKGESNSAALFWDGDSRTGYRPSHESKMQIFFLNEIQNHRLTRLIVPSREVEVKSEKKTDLKIQAMLPSGEATKVYIEVKRQDHREVFEAIEDQLTARYLIDPNSKFGIYLVGWYGKDDYWAASQRNIMDSCGSVPQTPQEMEVCLQAQADKVVSDRQDIDDIRVFVVDLSR